MKKLVKKERRPHDCKKCKYIGTMGTNIDMYVCDSVLGGSFIARFDSGPADYTSMPIKLMLKEVFGLEVA